MTLSRLFWWTAVLGAAAGIGWLGWTGQLGPVMDKLASLKGAPKGDVVAAPPAPAAAVSVVAAEMREFVETQLVTGTLVPREEILVGPEVEGLRIVEVLADEGDTVKKGQVLARLVVETLEAQVAANDAAQARSRAAIAQARSNIVSAEARQVEAKNALERARPLKSSGYLSEATLDQREAAARAADASLAAAQDALGLAEADLKQIIAQRRELDWKRGRADVPAPADGIISRRIARVGGFAAGAAEPMFRIIARGEIELEGEIPETRVARVRQGQSVAMEITGAPDLVGKVRLVSPEIDKSTRLGRVRVALPANPALRIGAFARGTITTDTSRGLGVPSGALQYLADGPVVQIVQDGKVAVRRVKLGLVADGYTEIRDGLAAKDLVIARAGTFLREGDAVRPVIDTKQAAVLTTGTTR
jgi:RND family efflux transporter MFP subunit